MILGIKQKIEFHPISYCTLKLVLIKDKQRETTLDYSTVALITSTLALFLSVTQQSNQSAKVTISDELYLTLDFQNKVVWFTIDDITITLSKLYIETVRIQLDRWLLYAPLIRKSTTDNLLLEKSLPSIDKQTQPVKPDNTVDTTTLEATATKKPDSNNTQKQNQSTENVVSLINLLITQEKIDNITQVLQELKQIFPDLTIEPSTLERLISMIKNTVVKSVMEDPDVNNYMFLQKCSVCKPYFDKVLTAKDDSEKLRYLITAVVLYEIDKTLANIQLFGA